MDDHFRFVIFADHNYPDFLQRQWIGAVFRLIHPFDDDQIDELTQFYRLLWSVGEKLRKRSKLLQVLVNLKNKKIIEEKLNLVEEIQRLDSAL